MKTYLDILNEMEGKTFHSNTFGNENVTLKDTIVLKSESGRMFLINSKDDVDRLYKDYQKSLSGVKKS